MISPKKVLFVFMLTGFALLSLFNLICLKGADAFDSYEVEQSYHAQLGYGTGLGMLEKWCALPNFNFAEEGGVEGWIGQKCDTCHIGAAWNPDKPEVQCLMCHPSADRAEGISETPTIEKCYTCHSKDTAKRGDLFDPDHEIHLKTDTGRSCLFCHPAKNHQIAKGTVIDTSEQTRTDPVVSCTSNNCHPVTPHTRKEDDGENSAEYDRLNQHCQKVACETCHINTKNRDASALVSRDWSRFKDGQPITRHHEPGWTPEYKWYDDAGPSADYSYLPVLGYAERRDFSGARIYPFNVIEVTWFIKSKDADLDDAIPVSAVKAAGKNTDSDDPSLLVTTEEDMRAYDDPADGDSAPDYPEAALITRGINFNLTHSIAPKEKALTCTDCHGINGLLKWNDLGYKWGNPRKEEE